MIVDDMLMQHLSEDITLTKKLNKLERSLYASHLRIHTLTGFRRANDIG